MLETITEKSLSLPDERNNFSGRQLPEGLALPSSLLLYCRDYCWPHANVSSRNMLIFPLTELTYEIEGRRYLVHPGQALLIPPYQYRSVPELHQNYLRLFVSFEAPMSQSYLPESLLMEMSDQAWRLLDSVLDYYHQEQTSQAILSLTLLLYELSHHSDKGEKREFSLLVQRVFLLVNQYLAEFFSIKDLAANTGASASHLRRQFRKEVGVSLGEYMARHRLDAARRQLVETSHSIAEVAESCGYDSVFSFSRFFKNRSGQSPSEFRKNPTLEW